MHSLSIPFLFQGYMKNNICCCFIFSQFGYYRTGLMNSTSTFANFLPVCLNISPASYQKLRKINLTCKTPQALKAFLKLICHVNICSLKLLAAEDFLKVNFDEFSDSKRTFKFCLVSGKQIISYLNDVFLYVI